MEGRGACRQTAREGVEEGAKGVLGASKPCSRLRRRSCKGFVTTVWTRLRTRHASQPRPDLVALQSVRLTRRENRAGSRPLELTAPGERPYRNRASSVRRLSGDLGDEDACRRDLVTVHVKACHRQRRGGRHGPEHRSGAWDLEAGNALVLEQRLDHLGLVEGIGGVDEAEPGFPMGTPGIQTLPALRADVLVAAVRLTAVGAVAHFEFLPCSATAPHTQRAGPVPVYASPRRRGGATGRSRSSMARELRLVHTSDVHLDASFRATGVPSARARERCVAHLEAFDRVVELARSEAADALLIAGDLFETAYTRPATVRHVAKRLAAWGKPVCIAPGNHDPIRTDSVYAFAEWPANVTLFEGAWNSVSFPELELTVHGRGFTEPEEHERLFEGLSIESDGLNVVVAHGSDESSRPDRHQPYRPFTLQELDTLRADYVALGHYHTHSLLATRRVAAAYSGSPIPQGFQDESAHGALLVRLSRDAVDVALHPLPAPLLERRRRRFRL